MGERSFAGYSYRDEIGDGFYGEEYAAIGPSAEEARVLHVAPRLSAAAGYAEALARFGSDLASLTGEGVVATNTVGRSLDGSLIVVTAGVGSTATLEAVRASARGQAMPATVALAVAKGLVDAMAHAHQRGIAHGALHPRSVLIDAGGAVLVDHFAVGRALASVAAANDDPALLSGFRGYLAPELALAEEPTPRSDVYAIGAVLHMLFGGEVAGSAQPGRLKATTSVRRLVVRAMDTDASRRFESAIALGQELERALVADRCELASADDLAIYTEDARGPAAPRPVSPSPSQAATSASPVTSADALDDLIADLEPEAVPEQDEEEPTAISPTRRSSSPAVDDVLDSLDEPSVVGSDPLAGFAATPQGKVATRTGSHPVAVSPEESEDHSQLTQVDDALVPDRDPISELIEMRAPSDAALPDVELGDDADDDDGLGEVVAGLAPARADSDDDRDDHTPLPPPFVHESGSFTKRGQDVLRGKGGRSVQERAEDAISALDDPTDPPPRAPRVDTDYVGRRRIPGWAWAIGTFGAVAVMFLLVWTRTDVFHPERAERKAKAREAERLAKEAELRAQQKKAGEIIVEANEEGAAVWMRLGRTPLETMPLPAYHPHQLRFELDGYAHLDTVVVAGDWDKNKGSVTRTLAPAPANAAPTPAWPPAVEESQKQGFYAGAGLGSISIDSKPQQAEVWLLVGYTNSVHLREFEAGVRYEFKLTKEGFRTGFTVVEPDDWKLGGADTEALRRTVIERVELLPEAAAKPR